MCYHMAAQSVLCYDLVSCNVLSSSECVIVSSCFFDVGPFR